MYIKREELWWTLPILIALFLLGGSIAKLQEGKKSTTPTIAAREVAPSDLHMQRELTRQLLAQLTPDKQSPLSVETEGLLWTGHFQKDSIEISTKQDGKKLVMLRADGAFHFQVDGQTQDAQALPYSLFTPFEHARLLDKELNGLVPKQLSDAASGWKGYQLAMPADELKKEMSAWLGPTFTEAEIADALKQTKIVYELWYEPTQKKLKQFTMAIIGPNEQQGSHSKKEQVTFRF
ncbi:UNVERIFIED_CONTAM: hypothetical protein ABID98_002038 [Brevibacillus sp. OAP136]